MVSNEFVQKSTRSSFFIYLNRRRDTIKDYLVHYGSNVKIVVMDMNLAFKNLQVEILNSYAFGYSNGFLEGINNTSKVIKRHAFGYEHLKPKVPLSRVYKEVVIHLG